jgi:hydrogenase maturation protease
LPVSGWSQNFGGFIKLASTLVLGLGNSLRGDDGAGPAVIAALLLLELPPHVDVIDGGVPGLETTLLLQGYERVIIVDAANMGLEPGEWRRITPDTVELRSSENKLRGTLHAAGLAEALVLAGALDVLPDTLVIFGIQPQNIDWSPDISAALQEALPDLTNAIAAELRS